MALVVKTAIGLISLLSLGLSGLSMYSVMTPSTLGQELESQGFVLVNEDKTWKKLASKYKRNENTPERIKDLPKEESEKAIDKNSLKEKCKELWEAKLKNIVDKTTKENDLKNWCVTNAKALESSGLQAIKLHGI